MDKSQKYILPRNKNKNITDKSCLTIKQDFKNSTSFPFLSTTPNIKSQVNPFNMVCFANVVSGEEIIPKEKERYNPISPGWVRLSRSQDGKIIKTYGDPIQKINLFSDDKEMALLLHQTSIINKLEKNELWSFENGRDQYIHLSKLNYENSFYQDDDEEGECSDSDSSIDQ